MTADNRTTGETNNRRADPENRGETSLTPEPNHLFGPHSCCALDEHEWPVVGAYHQDDRSHGSSLGPEGIAVEQFAFVFGGEES